MSPQPSVKITARRSNEQILAIDIDGDLTAFAESLLMSAYAEADDQTKTILLNFTNMHSMTSSGIGLLVTLLIRANRQNQQIIAVGLNDHYQKIFSLTRLNEAIRVYQSEPEAISQVGVSG